jgi:4-oxalomesaconate tautomerase
MTGIPVALMRGGTSKGAVFRAEDLPADADERDALLLRVMGSPDPRQIDGLGGGHPLTSKVAVVSVSDAPGVDVDYLFLQVVVDEPVVSRSQTCGNMLAAVGPFAVERGLVAAQSPSTDVRVRMVNNGTVATLRVCTPGGVVTYEGDAEVSGVPGTAAPVEVLVEPSDSPLLPTGRPVDRLAGVEVTCIDAGMPSVLVRAADLGVTGDEEPEELEANDALVAKVRDLRAAAAQAMGMTEDLAASTTPKVVLVSAPAAGTIATRSFIPHRVHQAVGVLGAATVAAAVVLPGTVAAAVAGRRVGDAVRIEHPTGFLDIGVETTANGVGRITVLRTAHLIMDGSVHPAPARSNV